MSKINPTEIYLLQAYSSPEYFAKMRDIWGEMVEHLEACLRDFMLNLPADYRSRQLPEQPDIVWGERVLPNFRDTYQGLCDGYIKLTHGDYSGLSYASGPMNDWKGQSEFWSDWMTEAQGDRYAELLHRATRIAQNIHATYHAYWDPDEITNPSIVEDTVTVPDRLPIYRLDTQTSVNTGEQPAKIGIYVPDIDGGCPQFLHPRPQGAPPASFVVGTVPIVHPETKVVYGHKNTLGSAPCRWTLVTIADDQPERSEAAPPAFAQPSGRVAAGEKCPTAGYYFTPARIDSRRWFEQGETMPEFKQDYGATIWQWDQSQEG